MKMAWYIERLSNYSLISEWYCGWDKGWDTNRRSAVPYAKREDAEAEAFIVTVRLPHIIGRLRVVQQATKKPRSSWR